MAVVLEVSEKAWATLLDPEFRRAWQALHERCPWATTFQGIDFVTTWYRIYADAYEPVIVYSRAARGGLDGLLTLARARSSHHLAVAGAHQAEYQAWLAPPGVGNKFITASMHRLSQETPASALRFKYLPPGAPLGWVREQGPWARSARLRGHARPLMRIDGAAAAAALRKKSNRSRLNRLKRLGDLNLRRIITAAELDAVIDQIAAQYDLRQGAISGALPFLEDPRKRPFYVELMRHPGVLDVTVLKGSEQILAALIGVRTGAAVSVGVFSYAPCQAKNSPGKFLILMLARRLADEGVAVLDLTPGGEWKERFATDHDQVQELTVYFANGARMRAVARERLEPIAKVALAAMRLSPAALRALAARARRVTPRRLAARVAASVWDRREHRVYAFALTKAPIEHPEFRMAVDSIADLVTYASDEPWQSRGRLLRAAMERLANGVHAYTFRDGDRVLYLGWFVERQNRVYLPEVEQAYPLGPDAVFLFDFYIQPDSRACGLLESALRQMLADAARLPGIKRILVATPADDAASRHEIEKLGFRHMTSVFRSVHLGVVRKWSVPPTLPQDPTP